MYHHIYDLPGVQIGLCLASVLWDPRRILEEFHVHPITIYSNQTCLNRRHENYSSEYFFSTCLPHWYQTCLNKIYVGSFIYFWYFFNICILPHEDESYFNEKQTMQQSRKGTCVGKICVYSALQTHIFFRIWSYVKLHSAKSRYPITRKERLGLEDICLAPGDKLTQYLCTSSKLIGNEK